jgi:hypothetical protein
MCGPFERFRRPAGFLPARPQLTRLRVERDVVELQAHAMSLSIGQPGSPANRGYWTAASAARNAAAFGLPKPVVRSHPAMVGTPPWDARPVLFVIVQRRGHASIRSEHGHGLIPRNVWKPSSSLQAVQDLMP